MVSVGNATYLTRSTFSYTTIANSWNLLIKLNPEGKTVWSKRTSDSSWLARRVFAIQNRIYIEEAKLDSIRILNFDTNGNFIKGRYIPKMNVNGVHNEKILLVDLKGLNGSSSISLSTLMAWLSKDLELVTVKVIRDSLGLPLQILDRKFAVSDSSLYFTTSFKDVIPGVTFNSYILKLDTNLKFGNVSSIYNGIGYSMSSAVRAGNDSILINESYGSLVDFDTVHYSIYDKRNDTVYHKKIRQNKSNLDTISSMYLFSSFNQQVSNYSTGYIYFNTPESSSSNYFYTFLIPGRNQLFVYRFNNQRLSLPSFNQLPLPQSGIGYIHSPVSNQFPFRKGFFSSGLAFNVNANDPANCLASRDSAQILDAGKVKVKRVSRLFFADTIINTYPVFISPQDFPFCNMDFCNPLTYSGLGPDIQTCADSVMLQGKVVYAGQKLQWSTSDTTLQVKVPVGAGNTYSIKISGICGTFDDTIVVQPKTTVSVDFPQSQDSVKTCKPILLQPTAQQWIAPRWFTPKGVILNQQQLFADTSGFYIIQNDEGDCARRDTIYIDLQPVSRPDLQLPDTILTCKDVLLSPMANQWGNPSWQTPGGVFGSISITANLTGKYVVQNEILGCRAKDSVYIIRKVPSVISFFNQPDTVFTCQSVLLSPVAQPFISPVWQTPNGTFTNVNSFRATSSGAYKVTNDIGNCANSDSVYIVYRDTADIDFLLRSGGANLTNFDIVLKENQFPFVVDAVTQTQAFRYKWFLNGQIQNGNGFTEGFSLPNPGVYTIDLLTQTVDSCIGKARKVLTIQELILPAPVIPNLVTLNGDQQNEHFEIEQLPLYTDNELIIYNRWGKEIFRSRPYQNDWPPSDLSAGTYFYRVQAGEVTYQGWVEVVRN